MINDGEVTLDKLKLYGPFAASHSSGTKYVLLVQGGKQVAHLDKKFVLFSPTTSLALQPGGFVPREN